MKTTYSLIAWILIGAAVSAAGQAVSDPVVVVTSKSHAAFTEGVSKITNRLNPESEAGPEVFLLFLLKQLGISELEGIDHNRAWHVAIWHKKAGGSPLVGLYIPISDYEVFEQGIAEKGMLAGLRTANRLVRHDTYAVARIAPSPSANEKAPMHSVTEWDLPETPANGMLQIRVSPNDAVREWILSSLEKVKKGLSAAFTSDQTRQELPYEPEALMGIMELYLNVFETGIKGVEDLKLNVDVTESALTLDEHLTPTEGSTLQELLSFPSEDLSSVLPYLNPEATFSGAMHMGDQPIVMKWLGDLMELNIKLQSAEIDPKIQEKLVTLMKEMAPMVVGGSVWIDDGISFAGVYSFPERSASSIYAQIVEFFDTGMEAFTGENQMYSSITREPNYREVEGVSIDRYTFALNLDSPYFQMPGQKEMLNQIWPEGRFVIEYAVSNDKMLIASPDRMEDLLGYKRLQPLSDIKVSPRSAAVAQGSPIAFFKTMLAANPMLPEEMKKLFMELDPTGTEVTFKADVEGALHSQLVIPLKLFETLGKLKSAHEMH